MVSSRARARSSDEHNACETNSRVEDSHTRSMFQRANMKSSITLPQ